MNVAEEYADHARERDAALRRIARDDEWLRMWQTRMACRLDTPFNRWYAERLDAGMARLEQQGKERQS